MNDIEYVSFSGIGPEALLPIVNDQALRKHLVDHPLFDTDSIEVWVRAKVQTDAIPGCRVRVVFIDGSLAGWCGIQPDDKGFEIAIVLAKEFWGVGTSIFKSVMTWARELGHQEIRFHLLETRPEYKALKRKASKVEKTELLGRSFTTYFILVDKWFAG